MPPNRDVLCGLVTSEFGSAGAPPWRERFLGGSADRERELIAEFVRDIAAVQRHNQRRGKDTAIRRAFHAKMHAGITNAELRVLPELADDLRTEFLVPGAAYRAVVRFSNAAGTIRPDAKRDLRGIAVRVFMDEDTIQDFVLTNAPASHARDARQFMAAATALAAPPAALAPLRLARSLGPREAWRLLMSLRRATSRKTDSLVSERYWSRAPFLLGPVPVKFVLRPLSSASRPRLEGADYLREDLRDRLRVEALRFELCAQRFVDESTTPIEDGSVEWKEADSPCEAVADLLIPVQDIASSTARSEEALVGGLAFSPWNAGGRIRPLGSLNRARKAVYAASAQQRQRT